MQGRAATRQKLGEVSVSVWGERVGRSTSFVHLLWHRPAVAAPTEVDDLRGRTGRAASRRARVSRPLANGQRRHAPAHAGGSPGDDLWAVRWAPPPPVSCRASSRRPGARRVRSLTCSLPSHAWKRASSILPMPPPERAFTKTSRGMVVPSMVLGSSGDLNDSSLNVPRREAIAMSDGRRRSGPATFGPRPMADAAFEKSGSSCAGVPKSDASDTPVVARSRCCSASREGALPRCAEGGALARRDAFADGGGTAAATAADACGWHDAVVVAVGARAAAVAAVAGP